jgi:hypothetical protein
MKTEVKFHDPFFTSLRTDEKDGLKISYPVVDKEGIREVSGQLRRNAEEYFSSHSVADISKITDEADSVFADPSSPENSELVDLIIRSCGFSGHDIVRWGLGLFRSIVSYDQGLRGYYIEKAIRRNEIIETKFGYLKKIGIVNPFNKWKEPTLLSHFISGNVVGYTAILCRIGLPVKGRGAAQILKLPSAASLFPMIYLDKINSVDPELRKTIACGYWKGGDDSIERLVIEESDAVNILSSDQTIKDLQTRIEKYHRGITTLLHGHKIGIAYISKEFINDPDKLQRVMSGLVTDISAFDGGACYNVKNIYIQGEPRRFAEMLFTKLESFEKEVSPVSAYSKPASRSLYQVYSGSNNVFSSDCKSAFVRVKDDPEFWKPEELFRYVQVMKVTDEREVCQLLKKNAQYLQTAIIAVPDEKIIPVLISFGKAGISNIHYPGSAPLMNVYEEPHDGEFDSVRIRYNYSARFAATNFKSNNDWIN